MVVQHVVEGIFFTPTESFRLLVLPLWLLSGWHEGSCSAMV